MSSAGAWKLAPQPAVPEHTKVRREYWARRPRAYRLGEPDGGNGAFDFERMIPRKTVNPGSGRLGCGCSSVCSCRPSLFTLLTNPFTAMACRATIWVCLGYLRWSTGDPDLELEDCR